MKTLITGLVSLSALAFAAPALADHHGDTMPANDGPSHEACMEMHEAMMPRHEAGEDHASIMASLTDEERAQAEACHAMMGEHHGEDSDHSGHHGAAGDHNGHHDADDAHGEHGDHGAEHGQDDETDAHAGHH